MQNNFLELFPKEMRPLWVHAATRAEELTEIRFRIGQPVFVTIAGEEWMLGRNGILTSSAAMARLTTAEEIGMIVEYNCKYSRYAFEEEIRQGFLTVPGGHRIGLAGQAVQSKQGAIETIKNISSLNIRVAHEVKGVADSVMKHMYEDGHLRNTLIISPPGGGKTTMLRDLVRQISNGNPYGKGVPVGVVDERSEIAGNYLGYFQNDVGCRTDVMDTCKKSEGMMLLVRSMAPAVIAVDEIGSKEDMEALREVSTCGCSVLATAHGKDLGDVSRRLQAENIKTLFSQYMILEKGAKSFCVKEIGRIS